MNTTPHPGSRAVEFLGPEVETLARGLPPCRPGTLFALGEKGGVRVDPDADFVVVFGRNEPEVHVCVGRDDRRISRRQGTLRRYGAHWSVTNTGRTPIRLPGSQLVLAGHEEPLPAAYTPMFIRSSAGRDHLLEVRIASSSRPASATPVQVDEDTELPETWYLAPHERLAVVVLGQRYLRHEPNPQPLTWAAAAEELDALQPGAGWTARRIEYVVGAVRRRLIGADVPDLTREQVGEPVGNALNHNLLIELLLSATIVAPDLRLLDE